MTPLQADARLGQLVPIAFDMYASSPESLTPAADPRLSPDWVIRGYITAQDVILLKLSWLEVDAPRVCYGFLVESVVNPGQFVAVVRGTADMHEWVLDAKFAQVRHPAGGMVESGFYAVFESMRYVPAHGGRDSQADIGIASAVGQGSLTVVGHSLGAALATFLTLDLATLHVLGDRLRGRFFASPRPGNQGFADVFAANVKDAVSYVSDRDLVPESPLGFGYLHLHCMQLMEHGKTEAVITDSKACAHHIYSYLAQMDWGLMDWRAVPVCDKSLTTCIIGPATH